jgi:preprotein translocase subunit SecY
VPQLSSTSSADGGALIGLAIGVVVVFCCLLLLVVVLVVFLRRRQRQLPTNQAATAVALSPVSTKVSYKQMNQEQQQQQSPSTSINQRYNPLLFS